MSRSGLLAKAIKAFGDMPEEVRALGKPLSVHSPSSAAQTGMRVAAKVGIGGGNTLAKRILAAGLAVGLPLIGCGFVIPYLLGAAFGQAGPEGWLIIPVSGLVFGLISAIWCVTLFLKAGKEGPAGARPKKSGTLPGLIVYPDALVHVVDGEFTVIRWKEVQSLEGPPAAGCWRVTANDGRTIDVPAWIEDEGEAVASTMQFVTAALLPQLEERIEAGQKVMFGPFGVSKRFVYFKDKKTEWKDVTSMRLLTGAENCLKVYCGGMLPWCSFQLLEAPNGELVYDLLSRVAPPRLLQSK